VSPLLLRRSLIVLAVLLCAAALAYFGFAGAIRSDWFRDWLSRRVSRSLRAEGEFEPLHWTGNKFFSRSFTARGSAKSKLTRLYASEIEATIDAGALLRGQIVIERLRAARLEVTFGKKPADVLPPEKKSGGGWKLPNILPGELVIRKMDVDQVTLHWQTSRGQQGQLSGTQVEATRKGAESWKVVANGGFAQHAAFPRINLVRADGTVDEKQVTVTEAAIQTPSQGTIKLKGNVAIDGPPVATVQATFSGLQLKAILPADWHFTGTTAGSVNYEGNLNEIEAGRATGHIDITNANLDFSALFGKLRPLLKAGGLDKANLDTAQADFSYENKRADLSRISASYRDQLRIEGDAGLQKDRVDARLLVGAAPEILQWFPGADAKVFTNERDGLRWAPMHLSGPWDHPKEDLSRRVLEAVRDTMADRLKKEAKSLLEQLGQ
jgi:hypothetical protein